MSELAFVLALLPVEASATALSLPAVADDFLKPARAHVQRYKFLARGCAEDVFMNAGKFR